jgi:hypothetical protein
VTTVFVAEELHKRFRADPTGVRKELAGKRVTVSFDAVWRVEDIEKCYDQNGDIAVFLTFNSGGALGFVFPGRDKLVLADQIRGYARRRQVGDKVSMKVSGVLGIAQDKRGEYLVLREAVLK